jgi:vanillate O-demethylase ferredoxin subunit
MITVEVKHAEEAAIGVRRLLLRAVDGTLPAFSPGAHVDVEIRPGLVRQYSLCGHAEADVYEIAVLREPASRGGSAALCDDVHVGDRLRISTPRNLFALQPAPSRARLVAGGIGITPILAMARSLRAEGRDFRLWYAGRVRAGMAFHEEVGGSHFAGQATVHADDEAGGPLDLRAVLAEPAPDEHLYVCGPPGLIAATLELALASGWSSSAIHREAFSAASSTAGDTAFTVSLARSGRRFEVPTDRTVLDILRDGGVDLEYSCEQGVCGSCLVKVLHGEPDHRDMVLTDEERAANDQFTPCCSRSHSRELVLDL